MEWNFPLYYGVHINSTYGTKIPLLKKLITEQITTLNCTMYSVHALTHITNTHVELFREYYLPTKRKRKNVPQTLATNKNDVVVVVVAIVFSVRERAFFFYSLSADPIPCSMVPSVANYCVFESIMEIHWASKCIGHLQTTMAIIINHIYLKIVWSNSQIHIFQPVASIELCVVPHYHHTHT